MSDLHVYISPISPGVLDNLGSILVRKEIYTNGYPVGILDLLSLMAIVCGILIILAKNPIVSVLFLIGLFICIAAYLSILGLSFIGLAYLLVYVGAVSILFLFILMLINVRVSELLSNTSNSIPLAIFVCLSFGFTINHGLPYSGFTAFFNSFIFMFNAVFSWFLNIIPNNNFNNVFKLKGIEQENREIFFVTSKL
jgi:NADH-ubiquinone oxidoreductase chain 6